MYKNVHVYKQTDNNDDDEGSDRYMYNPNSSYMYNP